MDHWDPVYCGFCGTMRATFTDDKGKLVCAGCHRYLEEDDEEQPVEETSKIRSVTVVGRKHDTAPGLMVVDFPEGFRGGVAAVSGWYIQAPGNEDPAKRFMVMTGGEAYHADRVEFFYEVPEGYEVLAVLVA